MRIWRNLEGNFPIGFVAVLGLGSVHFGIKFFPAWPHTLGWTQQMQMAKLDGAKILSELTQNSFQLAAKGRRRKKMEGGEEVNYKLL
jgi:hypothetical protein